MLLLINIMAFAIPYIIIFIVSARFAKKNSMPFKTVLKFNDYVKNAIGATAIFQFVFIIIDSYLLFYLNKGNDYSSTENLIIVTCTNLMLFEPALALTALGMAREAMGNIKKILSNKSIKF